jgi:hypothetical protein
MIGVCFAGITGWTAPPILQAIDAADDLPDLRSIPIRRRQLPTTRSRSDGLIYASVAEALDARGRCVGRLHQRIRRTPERLDRVSRRPCGRRLERSHCS